MSVDYAARLEAIKDALAAIAPARTVTRTYADFMDRRDSDLTAGLFTIVSLGVREYADIEPPGDFGRQRLAILFQGRVGEDADGPAIEAAEYAAMNELERLAAEHDPAVFPELILLSAETSGQLEAPYCWVRSEWELWTDPNPI